MKLPVLWLASVSLSVWVGTEKGVCLAWDLVCRSRITLYFGAKAVKTKTRHSCPWTSNSLRKVRESRTSLRSLMNVINIFRSRRKVSWLGLDSATLDSKSVNVRSYSSRLRDQNTALSTSSVDKWLLAPCIIRTRESKKSSTFGIHWAAMFLIGTASLSFCSGYESAHLHKITRQNKLYVDTAAAIYMSKIH